MIKLGNKVCVLGGAGFVGRAVVPALAAAGYQVTVAVRRPERYRELGLVPQVKLVRLDGFKSENFMALFQGQDCVVNLLADQTNITETVDDEAFVVTTQAIKQAAERIGLARLIQLSQIGANATQAKSTWLRVLGEADGIVHNMASTITTILRAGLLIGDGDHTTSLYKKHLTHLPIAMIPHAGTQVQPLWIKDFARAVVQSIKQSSCFNAKLEVAGEERMTVEDLAHWVKDFLGLDKATILPMCQLNAKFMLMLGLLAPFKTVTQYQQKQLAQDLITQQDFSTQFGFEPTSMEMLLASYVVASDVRRRYDFFRTQAGRKSQEFK